MFLRTLPVRHGAQAMPGGVRLGGEAELDEQAELRALVWTLESTAPKDLGSIAQALTPGGSIAVLSTCTRVENRRDDAAPRLYRRVEQLRLRDEQDAALITATEELFRFEEI